MHTGIMLIFVCCPYVLLSLGVAKRSAIHIAPRLVRCQDCRRDFRLSRSGNVRYTCPTALYLCSWRTHPVVIDYLRIPKVKPSGVVLLLMRASGSEEDYTLDPWTPRGHTYRGLFLISRCCCPRPALPLHDTIGNRPNRFVFLLMYERLLRLGRHLRSPELTKLPDGVFARLSHLRNL